MLLLSFVYRRIGCTATRLRVLSYWIYGALFSQVESQTPFAMLPCSGLIFCLTTSPYECLNFKFCKNVTMENFWREGHSKHASHYSSSSLPSPIPNVLHFHKANSLKCVSGTQYPPIDTKPLWDKYQKIV